MFVLHAFKTKEHTELERSPGTSQIVIVTWLNPHHPRKTTHPLIAHNIKAFKLYPT